MARIVEAAKAGKVPVHLVSSKWRLLLSTPIGSDWDPIIDLSEKNPLAELPHDASVVSLLGVFSSGAHRGLRPIFTSFYVFSEPPCPQCSSDLSLPTPPTLGSYLTAVFSPTSPPTLALETPDSLRPPLLPPA